MLSVEDYPPGVYNLTIEARDFFGQAVTEVIAVYMSGQCGLIRSLALTHLW